MEPTTSDLMACRVFDDVMAAAPFCVRLLADDLAGPNNRGDMTAAEFAVVRVAVLAALAEVVLRHLEEVQPGAAAAFAADYVVERPARRAAPC